jgi:hypothetical protein
MFELGLVSYSIKHEMILFTQSNYAFGYQNLLSCSTQLTIHSQTQSLCTGAAQVEWGACSQRLPRVTVFGTKACDLLDSQTDQLSYNDITTAPAMSTSPRYVEERMYSYHRC